MQKVVHLTNNASYYYLGMLWILHGVIAQRDVQEQVRFHNKFRDRDMIGLSLHIIFIFLTMSLVLGE